MDQDSTGKWLLHILLGAAGLLVAYGLMKLLIALAARIPHIVTGFAFVFLQVVVLVVSVIVVASIGGFIVTLVLNRMAKFESRFIEDIESLRRSINELSNNLAAEVLAVITSVLVALAQESFGTNILSRCAIGLLLGLYLLFSVQLIKSKKKKDKAIGVFFYVFPALVAGACYAVNLQKFIDRIEAMQGQDIVLAAGALITLFLALYYSFMPQSGRHD
ncbi:MAG: hypothetical protein ACYTAS_14430 [Planctomycetota bacterium]|jgi:hypothetical protein